MADAIQSLKSQSERANTIQRLVLALMLAYFNPSYNAKFWRAPIGRNRSRDAIVSLLSGRLSAHSARFWQFSLKI